MFPRYLSLFVLALLMAVLISGCVRAPASAQTNVPVLPTVTAAPGGSAVEAETAASSATAPAEATSEDPGAPTAAATPEPRKGTVAHYQGPNPYRATPRFDVAYDTALWEYVEDDGSGRQSQLKHRLDPGCILWLRAGPVAANEVATVWLAKRAWTLSQVQSQVILYSAPEGDIGWNFGVLLPEVYSGMGNSSCQDAAERVIDTFTAVE